jgi:hypothetical protein
VWDRLAQQVETELEQLCMLFRTHSGLLSRSRAATPSTDEVPAIAAILHSFYTGVEGIFKRIATEVDGKAPRGEFWHADLLEAMSRHLPQRPAVISRELNESLQEYMDFRHVFRHAYTFELRWPKMAPLVKNLDSTFPRLVQELTAFLHS